MKKHLQMYSIQICWLKGRKIVNNENELILAHCTFVWKNS